MISTTESDEKIEEKDEFMNSINESRVIVANSTSSYYYINKEKGVFNFVENNGLDILMTENVYATDSENSDICTKSLIE